MQLWDYYYSYKQYESFPSEPDININFNIEYQKNNNLKILHVNFLDVGLVSEYVVTDYDLILVDNDVEHLSTNDDIAIEFVKKYNHAYFLVGSFVSEEHKYFNKILTLPRDWFNCQNWYSNPKTFVKYSNKKSAKDKDIVFIGGRLKTYRKYILDNLPNKINVIQNSKSNTNTNDAVFGDEFDTNFINECNNMYSVTEENEGNIFYNSLRFGFKDRPFGYTPIGYWLLPAYNTHKCIVYPEASFLNNEVYPTEKTWKCVVSKTHWIMFAGMNSYHLMKHNGIRSILELVPGGILFDKIANHKERIKQQIKGIDFLSNNIEIFESTKAQTILRENFDNFFIKTTHVIEMVNKLDNVINEHI